MYDFGQRVDIIREGLPEFENVLGIRVQLKLTRRCREMGKSKYRGNREGCISRCGLLFFCVLVRLSELRDWRRFQL